MIPGMINDWSVPNKAQGLCRSVADRPGKSAISLSHHDSPTSRLVRPGLLQFYYWPAQRANSQHRRIDITIHGRLASNRER